MASGTPLLTTRLPGMPKDYFQYVYFIDEESEEGMERAIIDITSKTPDELHSFGDKSKRFILSEKNNVKQAEKLIKFIKTLL